MENDFGKNILELKPLCYDRDRVNWVDANVVNRLSLLMYFLAGDKFLIIHLEVVDFLLCEFDLLGFIEVEDLLEENLFFCLDIIELVHACVCIG